MALIASGINKYLVVQKQAALGTIALANSATARNMRRTTSSLDYTKATYASKEIRPSQQRADFRHGTVGVAGTITGELSVGTYQQFTESICRQNVLPSVTVTAAASDYSIAGTSGAAGTITTVAGNFLTSGFRLGMVIRAGTGTAGFSSTGTANNVTNLLIVGISVSGKVLTVVRLDGLAVATKAAETQAVTLASVGKHTFVPQSGFTRDYYTIEHNFADVVQSEVFTDVVVTQMNVKLPGSGMAGVDFAMKGLNMVTGPISGGGTVASPYFTSVLPVTSGAVLASANGIVFLNGVAVGLITAMNFSIKGNHTNIGGVVGTNVEPDIFPGDVTADGQMTILFQDSVIRDIFRLEQEVSVLSVFTTNLTGTADFQAYAFPRIKLGGASKDDGEKGLVMTCPFTALENIPGSTAYSTSFPTTVMIQDSTFA